MYVRTYIQHEGRTKRREEKGEHRDIGVAADRSVAITQYTLETKWDAARADRAHRADAILAYGQAVGLTGTVKMATDPAHQSRPSETRSCDSTRRVRI